MNILLLCEGNAETRDSWSGVSKSVLEHLRAAGHTVIPGDVDLYGFERMAVAARTPARSRRRWWVRYHLDVPGFRARSAHAYERLQALGGDVDVILQVGATFRVPDTGDIPLVLYCDSSIELARAGRSSGYSEAAVLDEAEMNAIRHREATVYRDARYIFTMSELLRRSFIDDFGIPPDRLVTVHCGPNVPLEDVTPARPAQQETPTILFVGRDFERKGGDLLLQAFPQVRHRLPGARLRIVGANTEHVPVDGVDWLGFQSRDTAEGRAAMDTAYRTATVFCVPTRFDPFGTSFIEAMGYGLPCIGPNAWAVPEMISHEKTGLLVPPEDAEALADALVRLLSQPEAAGRMGEAGRRQALAEFSWPKLIDRMLDKIEPLAHSGRNR